MDKDIDYAQLDLEKILIYIAQYKEKCPVYELFNIPGVERLRVYPSIYRLKELGILEITDCSYWGTPTYVKMLK